MPKLQPFPAGFLEHTSEHHLAPHTRKSQIVYIAIIVSLIAGVGLLPFLYVDVSVKSFGSLRAATQLSILKAASSGFVKTIYAGENMEVRKGQLLFEVQSPLLEEKERFLKMKLEEIDLFMHDLLQVKDSRNGDVSKVWDKLSTPLYRQSVSDYRQKLSERQVRYQKVKTDFNRNKKLFDEKVIAPAEFENFKFELDKAQGDLDLLRQAQLSIWLQDLRAYEKEAADYRNQLDQLIQEKKNLNIKAPISGTLQSLAGIYPGSPVFTNQDLAQISPDTSLLAIVYVSPNDIGLLREGMEVRMQITAFNYNQWGLLPGKLKEISNDIQIRNEQPVFEVRCTLNKDHLSLKNGYKGKLKKGMNLQARFVVTRRSLWDLLYDKVDNWINPNIAGH
jgi:HlyD family secretion protein